MKNKFIAFVDFRNIRQALEQYYPEVDLEKARIYDKEIVDDNDNHYVLLNSREPYSLNGRKFDEVVDVDGFRHELYTLRLNFAHDKQVRKEVVEEIVKSICKKPHCQIPTMYGEKIITFTALKRILDEIEKE